MTPDPLSQRRIATALAGQPIGHDVQVFDELASTSDHVKDLGLAGFPHGLVVFAEQQTQGRGRRDNRWQSEPYEDLMLSILLRPTIPLEFWPRLTGIAALALCRTIESTTPLKPLIKWPNDVFVDGKKVAGILAETFTSNQGPFMVLGIGLNINRSSFPEELTPIATSLRLSLGPSQPQPRERIAITLLKQLNQLTPFWQDSHEVIIQGIRERSLLIGRAIRAKLDDHEISGQAIALNDEGHLIVAPASGPTFTLTSAEQVRWS
ncbi:biotin--[acetyl-CoA-carboxylase] ligase [Phragmitibacter flavus]|nr:biotin--[acetyl-CoA-carboxylase] ligase [Phragmitibacter flavus]